jgi:hypothetical protein
MLKCTRCSRPLDYVSPQKGELLFCPNCRARMTVFPFPALYEDTRTNAASAGIEVEGEAGCYYHPQKKAEAVCEGCGRFICKTCEVELHGKRICPRCLETGKSVKKLDILENNRILYDNIVLLLAIVPMLFVFPTIVTAPVTVYLVIRYWKAPESLIPRTKIRFVLAFLIAWVQIGWWVLVIFGDGIMN